MKLSFGDESWSPDEGDSEAGNLEAGDFEEGDLREPCGEGLRCAVL